MFGLLLECPLKDHLFGITLWCVSKFSGLSDENDRNSNDWCFLSQICVAGQEFGRASAEFFINKENVCKRDDPTVNRRRYWGGGQVDDRVDGWDDVGNEDDGDGRSDGGDGVKELTGW